MGIANDLRYALRQLRKSPVFTVAALLTLAVGIAATTAIFSVTERVLLAPLPYRNATSIVALRMRDSKAGGESPNLSGPDYMDIRTQTSAFAHTAHVSGGEMGVQLPDHAVFTQVEEVSPEFPGIFGLQPVAGVLFAERDATQQALVSAGFARDNFGSIDAALGKTIRVEAHPYVIAGVLPPGFSFPQKTTVWLGGPQQPTSMERTANNYRAVAQLKPGATLAEADAQLTSLSARLAAAYPTSHGTRRIVAISLKDALTGSVRSSLLLLMGAVGLVLLIVCVNIAHLQLARGAMRIREVAVRTALGAGTARILWEHALESTVLGVCGGALGVLLAWPTVQLLVRMAPDNFPRRDEIHLGAGIVLFAFMVSLMAVLVTACIPALQAMRVDPAQAMKHDTLRSGGDRRSQRWRNSMVMTEIALTFTLAVGAGLLLRTLERLSAADLGFATANRLVMYTHAPASSDAEYLRRAQELQQLRERLRQLPGVERVAGVMGLPGGVYGSDGSYVLPEKGQSFASAGLKEAYFSLASPDYFGTMDIPLMRGRDFSLADTTGSEPVAIVSESLARASFGAADPVGQSILCGLDEQSTRPMKIVGVVGDVRQQSPAEQPGAALYMPLAQHPSRANEVQIVMKTSVPAAGLITTVGRVTQAFDPEIATRFTTVDETMAATTTAQRFRTLLLGSFAGLGLLLAVAGVFSVMSYAVAQRRAEFGIRMALGAARTGLMALVLRQALRTAAVGLGAGLALSLVLARALSSMLFGVSGFDLITYLSAALLLFVAVVVAAFWPAQRAASVDPMEALRTE